MQKNTLTSGGAAWAALPKLFDRECFRLQRFSLSRPFRLGRKEFLHRSATMQKL
jgi:hypothetical protein